MGVPVKIKQINKKQTNKQKLVSILEKRKKKEKKIKSDNILVLFRDSACNFWNGLLLQASLFKLYDMKDVIIDIDNDLLLLVLLHFITGVHSILTYIFVK